MMKRKGHIVYDIDDVLADFWGTVLPVMNRFYGKEATKDQFVYYNKVAEIFEIESHQFLQFVVDKGLFPFLEPTPMVQVINNHYRSGNHVTVISSRDYHPEAYDITKHWLNKHGINHHDLFISGQSKKSDFVDSVDIIIDDHTKNIDDFFDAGVMSDVGVGILVDQPWNQNYTRKRVTRLK